MLCLGLLITVFFAESASHLNLYLNPVEVMRLVGVSAEVYYVRDGYVNNYALNFVIPVPANIRDISFTWQSMAGRPLPYNIIVFSSDQAVLSLPNMNISQIGEIPIQVQTFSIGMKCTGIQTAEVDIRITIEVILNRAFNNVTELVFRRKKICLQTDIEDDNLNGPQLLERNNTQLAELTLQFHTSIMSLLVGSLIALLLVIVIFVIVYCTLRFSNLQIQHMRTSSFQRLSSNHSSRTQYITSRVMSHFDTLPRKIELHQLGELQRRISELTVDRCRVRLSNLLQEGTFGRVYRGTYNDDQEVLVKTVTQHASQLQVSLLLQEGMSLYGALHQGILSVLGVSIEDHTTPFVLYPAFNNIRNLKLALLDPVFTRGITSIQIVKLSSQIAMALEHLHDHRVVHKDIATRNCVIDDQLRVKLSDSSLSRDLFPADYNCLGDSDNRPIKWMSLESLQKKQFSEASDTWSFGVLLWELCTFAKQPYAEVDPFEMEHYLMDGYRLAQPFNCPDELFSIMAYCWAVLPTERPSFAQLHVCLSEFYTKITRYV